MLFFNALRHVPLFLILKTWLENVFKIPSSPRKSAFSTKAFLKIVTKEKRENGLAKKKQGTANKNHGNTNNFKFPWLGFFCFVWFSVFLIWRSVIFVWQV